ncbi:MAG: HlyD family efflux transporter periplasmic adaptor subunit [Planctomycetes bacterium]|nr:HlyD family efflux transporter periplasmic adaptor subunit [Planctomycetota bacterium]MCH9724626.1 HlyD family efflux transporter periplasmic adaptor subunit [Planctomycetota bacterium]MCH9777915.1 HlyD family efflux transporter periplasmic adaptor subunit [Planctomycetota bacterium]MCH9792596.1 HlyD family efflux transporter periplasmic adaptor subunit [Planctomycetota bacterium]
MMKPLDKNKTAYLFLPDVNQCLCCSVIASLLLSVAPAFAQKKGDEPQTVSIQREAITLRHPRDYYVPLNLKPVRSIQVSSPIDGIVHSVDVKPGENPTAKTVLVRLDSSIPQAQVSRAEAALELAKQEQKNATGKNSAIAKAQVDLAEADLKIANIRLEQTIIRAPFKGEIFRTFTTPGAFVRAGQPLMELGDTSRLQVEIPLQREQAKKGASINLNVEEQAVQATVDQVLPLAPQFEKLRDLANSITSAVVLLDNKNNQYRPGQSVSVALIPRYSIAEIPTTSVTNTPEGARKIQIVRENVIRDLTPQILGQVGPERLFVSAAFNKDDEIIVSSSQPLPDGTMVQPKLTVGTTQASPTTPNKGKTGNPPKKKVSF